MGTMTREELFKRNHHFTVKDLKKFLADNPELSDDAVIVVERVEDVYFEKHGWSTYQVKGYHWHHHNKWNEDIDSGKYLDKDQYPNMKEEHLIKCTEEDLERSKDQYAPIWCLSKFKDDHEILFINMHY